jgi:hypothetical protein
MGFFESLLGAGGEIISGAENLKAEQEWDKLRSKPGFSGADYGKVDYAGDFNPELYDSPEAAQYETVTEDPRTREYQMQALSRMQGLADQAAGSQEALGRYNATSDANAVAAQREAGVRNQMAMRGQGGSAMDFMLQAQAGQSGANRAQSAGLQAAQQAALQRLQGTQGVMAGASNIRGMDANVATTNADIINKFNMYNTGNRNAVNMGNTDMTNAGNMRNINTRQGIEGTNTGIGNQSMDRDDRNAMGNLHAERDKLTGKGKIRDKRLDNIVNGMTKGGAAADSFMSMAGGGMG